ncbi:hypothetical protein LMG33810_002828 [Carnimonas sp. LMG 33810]
MTTMASNSQPTASAEAIKRDIAELIRPPRRERVTDVIARAMYVVAGNGTKSLWRAETSPYMVEPTDCLASRLYDAVIFVGPARTGKTVSLIDGFITYKILNDPGDGMIVQITEDKAREYSKKRLERTFNASPELIAKLSARGHDNNVHDKTFRAGNYLAIKWPSKNVFASSDFQFVLLTDYDRMDSDIGGEGSPFALASKRTQTFGSTGITMAESSPGRLISDPDWERSEDEPHAAPPTTGILDLYNQGDRRRFYWQCPESKCRQWFQPVMENFSFEAARPFCPHCGCMIEKSQKRSLNLGGRWVPEGCWLDTAGVMHGQRRNTRIASFWMEGPAAAYQQWDSLVTKYRAAEKTYEDTDDQTALQSCTNVDWGRPYINRLAVTPRSSDLLMKRREEIERRTVPEGVRFLTAAVDVQGGKNRRFVVQIHGWGAGRETWVIDRFNISEDRGPNNDQEPRQISPASHPEDWDLLTRDVLNRTYKLADGTGRRMPVLAMAVDTGGEKGSGDESVTSQAYEWYRRLRASGLAGRVYLVKGASSAQGRVRITYPDNTKRKDRHSSATGDIPLHLLGTDQLKDVVASMLDRDDPGAGYVHTPAWLGRWWFDEVTYEVRDAASGKWSRPGKRANEAFDLCVYNLAIFILIKAESIKWDSPPPWACPWDENPLIIPAGVDPREHLPAIQQQPHSKRRKRVVKSSITRRR